MLALCASVSAERTSGPELDHVTDAAGLLTESEREQLEKMAEQVTQKYRVGVYIVTVGDYRDYNQDGVYKATYTIYHQYNMGEGPKRNGIMLLLSMDDRDWAVFCYGERSEYAFNKYGTEKMEDVYLDNFRNDDWYGGFADYIRECDVYLQKPRTENPCGRACWFRSLLWSACRCSLRLPLQASYWAKWRVWPRRRQPTPTFPNHSSLPKNRPIYP